MGFDRDKPSSIPEEFFNKQISIVNSYKSIGVMDSFTCTPYEAYHLPEAGSFVSLAETNAAVFANSMLGLLTNKESALSALAGAITGKAPLSELRINELRAPKQTIKPSFEMDTELSYGLLGYFAGKEIKASSVGINGIKIKSIEEAKALSAGIGTMGDLGMFIWKPTARNNRIEVACKEH